MTLLPETLIGCCGTSCGACLAHHGEVAEEAERLRVTLRRQGFLSLARRLSPEEAPAIDAFFAVLDRLARTPACPGCGAMGGTPECPVRRCCHARGGISCAGCPDLERCAAGELPESAGAGCRSERDRLRLRGSGERAFPFSTSETLRRLCRKHGGWNLDNLRRIQSIGLEAWRGEMGSNPDFRTAAVKTDEEVW